VYRGPAKPARTGKVIAVNPAGVALETFQADVDKSKRVGIFEDFLGKEVNVTDGFWAEKDTSAAGTPTLAIIGDEPDGAYRLQFDSTNEAQILTFYMNDELNIETTKAPVVIFRARVNPEAATMDSATTLVFGLASAQNDTADSVASNCWFRVQGANLDLLLESDDTSTDTDDKDTGVDLVVDTWYEFKLDFANYNDVRAYYRSELGAQWQALIPNATLKIGDANVQVFVQLQKGADTNTDAFEIDYIQVSWDRSA
jgi:hypothetical protein